MQPVLSTVTIGQTGGPPAEPITPVDPTLQWARADVAPGEALGQLAYGTSVIGDGPFYAVSTAPGRSDLNGPQTPTLYRSDDALRWVTTGSPDHTINSVAASAGALYAVGTAGPARRPAVAVWPVRADGVAVDRRWNQVGTNGDRHRHDRPSTRTRCPWSSQHAIGRRRPEGCRRRGHQRSGVRRAESAPGGRHHQWLRGNTRRHQRDRSSRGGAV